MNLRKVKTALAGLFGLPSWNVRHGYHGSFLYFEFGKPKLIIREPSNVVKRRSPKVIALFAKRQVYPMGEWYLRFDSCEWRAKCRGLELGRRFSNGFSHAKMNRIAGLFNGQALKTITLYPERGTSIFGFDLGGEIETKPNDRMGEQWTIGIPKGHYFTYRADGKYSFEPATTQVGSGLWYVAPGGIL